jgi:hypothetical protein
MAGIDFDTVAGTKLYVAVAAPATFDAAGFTALTWVEVGQLTSVPSVLGREYNTATLETIGDAQVREKKGNFKLPNADFECAWAESDAGQIIVAAAANNNTVPSFKLVKQDTTKLRYFTAQVMKFVENQGTANDAVKGAFTLLRQRDTVIV